MSTPERYEELAGIVLEWRDDHESDGLEEEVATALSRLAEIDRRPKLGYDDVIGVEIVNNQSSVIGRVSGVSYTVSGTRLICSCVECGGENEVTDTDDNVWPCPLCKEKPKLQTLIDELRRELPGHGVCLKVFSRGGGQLTAWKPHMEDCATVSLAGRPIGEALSLLKQRLGIGEAS